MLFNWPSYYDSSTGTKSFYEADYKELSTKCGLSFSRNVFMSPPRIKSSSPPNFHTEFQIALDFLLKLIKDVLSMRQPPWAPYHKVAKVIDNIVEYAKIESFYLRAVSVDSQNLQSSPSFCFIIQRLVRLTKDIHLLCKYAQKKELPEFTETRRILRELIRSIRKRCLKFIEIYSNDVFETSDGAMSNIQELLIAQFLQLVKFLMNFTKYDDHKKYVETSASGMSCSDAKINDIWSLTNSSLRQVQNEEDGGSSVSPIPQRHHDIKKLNLHPHAGSVSTVPELLSLNDVLVRRKGSNTDDHSQPSARISYNGSIADLGGLSRRTSSSRPPMVTIERRRTADESDRPKLSRDIKSSYGVLEGENGGAVVEPTQGLRRSNSITEKKVGITGGKETARLEDVCELDSSVEQGSPKRARNYRELRRTRELWGIVDDLKGSAKPSLSKVDTMILPSRIAIEGESDSIEMHQAEQSGDEKGIPMSRINFMTENDIQTENEIEEEQPKLHRRFSRRVSVITDQRLKLMTMVANPEVEPVTPKGVASEEPEKEDEEEEDTPDMMPRRLTFQRGKTMFENTEFEECESPWLSPSPSPIKGRFVFKQEEIQEVNEDDSPMAKDKIQPRNNTFVRPRIKRRNSTSIIASSSKSPRKVKAAMAAQKEILKERKREKQGYCYQKKFQNERRQDFLSKIFGETKCIIQKHFECAHGIDVNRTDKENKKPFIPLETEEDEQDYNNHSPVKNMARLAYVPVTISESFNFFNKLRTERYEEVKVQPKKKQRQDFWKRAKDTLKAREFRESLQEEDDALSPTVSRRNKQQTLDVSSQGINNTLKSFKHKKTILIGPLRKTRECNKIMQPARGFFIGEQKENVEVTEDLEISLMLARLAFRKGRPPLNLSPDTLNNRSFDDSRDNSESGFSFKKRQSLFKRLFSPSPSGDTNNNSPRSDRSRSDSRDYGPAPTSATKPSLFKSLFKLNSLDIGAMSPMQRGRSNSIESVKENSSASPNNRNQSSFSAFKRPSLFKSLFKMSFFDKEDKSSAETPKIGNVLEPDTPSPSEVDSPSLRKSRSEHRPVPKRFY